MTYSIASNAGDPSIWTAYLLKLDFRTAVAGVLDTRYYCDAPFKVKTPGGLVAPAHYWTPRGFTFQSFTTEQLAAGGTLVLDNADLTFSQVARNGASQEGAAFALYHAWLDPAAGTVIAADAEIVSNGRILQLEFDGEHATQAMISTTGIVNLAAKVGGWLIGRNCVAKYKNALTCQATGSAAYCDRTDSATTGCLDPNKVSPPAAGGNQANFVGFRILQLFTS